ncbi:Uncharacterised protein [Klebsiella pneumoniae]|jgi:hypothetical protein|nr:Uncharacterised protein [Klebsiella pneumoniae]
MHMLNALLKTTPKCHLNYYLLQQQLLIPS